MDDALVGRIIDRDWQDTVAQALRLDLGTPERRGLRIDIPVIPPGSGEAFRAVLLCDDYDARPPLLDFADIAHPGLVGREYWPSIENAPMNAVTIDGRYVPILCLVGTRGYHLHPSHVAEQHPKSCWRLPAVVVILHRFLRMGRLVRRGV
jgi:hypothetical protein